MAAMTGSTRRPFARAPVRKRRAGRARPKSTRVSGSLKVRLRGRDDAPLSIGQLRQGLYELIRRLTPYASDYRAKQVSLYLTIVDHDGSECQLSASGEWTIWAYRCAADALDDDQAMNAGSTFEPAERP
jgi:hypothetical protein